MKILGYQCSQIEIVLHILMTKNAAKLLVDRIINSYITAFDELENNINKRCSEDFS